MHVRIMTWTLCSCMCYFKETPFVRTVIYYLTQEHVVGETAVISITKFGTPG